MFNEDAYKDPCLLRPLYEGSKVTVLEAVTQNLYVFSSNHGVSKKAISDVLHNEKQTLPKPNHLPASFEEARNVIKHLLIPLVKYEVCINDCLLFRGAHADIDTCPECGEPRRVNGRVRKTFTYMPLGPRLARWFGTSNLCQLLYADKIKIRGTLTDFTDGLLYKSWFQEGGVFEGWQEQLCVPLSLFTDGVNPNKHSSSQKSMWPLILTWINLPRNIRQFLGPMFLMGIIPSGINGSEPKNLEPYLEILTEELLGLTEFPVKTSYTTAPVKVKVALLQFLCDIPAYSKLLHLSGAAALRSCPYCQETGHYCHFLKKTIHLSNRSFLPLSDSMRGSSGFGLKERDSNVPVSYSFQEEKQRREEYDKLPNKHQKMKHQKETGMKGTYTFMKLPYHDRRNQMQPDGMHTIADFISHLMDMLTGKHDSPNIRNCEKKFDRFPEIWITANPNPMPPVNSTLPSAKSKGKRKRKRNEENIDPECVLPPTPWSLSKEQLKLADERASMIKYSLLQDITPGPDFTKPWTLRTMNSKLQFVTSGALEWCIKGFLPAKQEDTLQKMLHVIKRIVSPTLKEEDLPHLQREVHSSLALFERDFPLSMQNLVTHLIHHIVDGFSMYGPLYGRWLFAYERANGWITRQCLKKGAEESTVMETYAVYDWCMYMVLSQKFVPSSHSEGKSQLMSACENLDNLLPTMYSISSASDKHITLTCDMKNHMNCYYRSGMNMDIFHFEDSVKETLRYKTRERKLCAKSLALTKNGSLVKILSATHTNLFGNINVFLEHNVNFNIQTWAVIDIYPQAEKENGFFQTTRKTVNQRLVHVNLLSDPVVFVEKDKVIHILDVA
ncbi:uncharacterized protein LOC133198027 [Saccostrea echinata]|uniref:uncharacterized protein LOC133198027 n=1 Tax=Saccostrea echinata TaxID=191078 RepID=UPI002A817580|nr:uncharacterized protein LOC133198027 [Saccostrea echinata]